MGLFKTFAAEKLINLQEEVDKAIQKNPIIIKNQEEKSEIINLATSRELNHLKKRMWKFCHK